MLLACSALSSDPAPPADPDYGLIGRCPKSTYPCGNGCMPISAACCDDGTRRTSSYCTNSAGGGCFPNADRSCTAPGPSGTLGPKEPSEFCCASNGDASAKPEGSFDCPAGTHHCGAQSCVPIGQPCCKPGSLAVDCPTAADSNGSGGTCVSRPGMLCGVKAGICSYCPLGSCCASDPLSSDGSGRKCLPATGVCTGTPGRDSGTTPPVTNTCKYVWDCKGVSGCITVYGANTGVRDAPDKATCEAECKRQGACTCQGCT